jgi:hypothetical protein
MKPLNAPLPIENFPMAPKAWQNIYHICKMVTVKLVEHVTNKITTSQHFIF